MTEERFGEFVLVRRHGAGVPEVPGMSRSSPSTGPRP